MPSKEVTDRQKDARAVISAGEAHGAAAAERLEAQLREHARKGETVPDVAALMTLMGRRLGHALTALLAADRAHESELGDDAGPRTQRDEAAATTYEVCVEVREQTGSVLGDAALDLLGIKGNTPTDPSELATWAHGLSQSLRDKDIKLPEPKRRTARIDRQAMAEEVDAARAPLDAAIAAVTREKREAEATQVVKTRAMADHDAAFAQTAGLYVALFRAAGMNEIADKVRPSRRRPGRTEEGDVPEEPRGPAAPTG